MLPTLTLRVLLLVSPKNIAKNPPKAICLAIWLAVEESEVTSTQYWLSYLRVISDWFPK